MSHRIFRRGVLAAPFLAPRIGRTATWPERPVRLIVSFGAGGAADTTARILQPMLSQALGQPLVIENRGGAGGTLGAIAVARSPADGYTLLLDAASHVVAPLLYRNLPIDYETAFTPIGQVVSQPYAWVVAAALPPRDMAEFLNFARGRREPVTYGSPGNGSTGHIAGEAFAHATGLTFQHVPYRSGAEAATDLAAGTLGAVCTTISSAAPVVEAGRARFIAVTSARRSAVLPAVPTIAESAVAGFDVTSWNGVLGPAGLPPDIVQRVSAALLAAGHDAATRQRLSAAGFEPAPSTPAEFGMQMRRDREAFGNAVRRAGMVP